MGEFLDSAVAEIAEELSQGKVISEYPALTPIKGHFFSDHSTLTNRPDAKTQLSLIFLRIFPAFLDFFA